MPSPRVLAKGFSLVEVLVALVVISLGLLGIAKMQALALSSTADANDRSMAAIEADSLAASMHANKAYWASGAFGATLGTTGLVMTNGVIPAASGLSTVVNCEIGTTRAPATSAPCTNIQMASYDLQNWAAQLNQALPQPNTATIICTSAVVAVPINCTITLTWAEKLVGLNAESQSATTSAITTPTLTLYVEP